MTPKEALTLLSEVATKYLGTRADHELLKQAVYVLESAIAPKDIPSESP